MMFLFTAASKPFGAAVPFPFFPSPSTISTESALPLGFSIFPALFFLFGSMVGETIAMYELSTCASVVTSSFLSFFFFFFFFSPFLTASVVVAAIDSCFFVSFTFFVFFFLVSTVGVKSV